LILILGSATLLQLFAIFVSANMS